MKQYKEMYAVVLNEINKFDPMGLEPGKICPIDEYNIEAEAILIKLKGAKSKLELAEDMAVIFNEEFGEQFTTKDFFACADGILKKLNY